MAASAFLQWLVSIVAVCREFDTQKSVSQSINRSIRHQSDASNYTGPIANDFSVKISHKIG